VLRCLTHSSTAPAAPRLASFDASFREAQSDEGTWRAAPSGAALLHHPLCCQPHDGIANGCTWRFYLAAAASGSRAEEITAIAELRAGEVRGQPVAVVGQVVSLAMEVPEGV
jgi:hypothetical protein